MTRRVALVRSHLRFIPHFPNTLTHWFTAATLLAATACAFAQQASGASEHPQPGKSSSGIDFSLGAFGQLTPARTPTAISYDAGSLAIQTIQGTSSSAGILGAIRQSFRPWLGYSVNFGYSRFSEEYSQGTYFVPDPNLFPTENPTSSFSRGSIGTSMYELTGSYLTHGLRVGHVDWFSQFGGGVLSFLPTKNPSVLSVQFRPAMVFGAGMNYKLSKQWALRAEYRGLFYKNPDFRGANGEVPAVKLYTITSEPTISIVYRFGGKK